jgi:hypothetical protein
LKEAKHMTYSRQANHFEQINLVFSTLVETPPR